MFLLLKSSRTSIFKTFSASLKISPATSRFGWSKTCSLARLLLQGKIDEEYFGSGKDLEALHVSQFMFPHWKSQDYEMR